MCFFKRKREDTARIAGHDIYALKVLIKTGGGIYSPYQNGKWTLGKKKRVTKFDKLRQDNSTVYYGLHCFRNIDNAMKLKEGSKERVIYLVKIPKGAWYYENESEFCAQQLVLISEVKGLKMGK